MSGWWFEVSFVSAPQPMNCISKPNTLTFCDQACWFFITSRLTLSILSYLYRYDNYGRLTNVTYPTGRVSSYRTDSDSTVRVQTEGSNKEDISVTTNLSASGTFYTLMQGKDVNNLSLESLALLSLEWWSMALTVPRSRFRYPVSECALNVSLFSKASDKCVNSFTEFRPLYNLRFGWSSPWHRKCSATFSSKTEFLTF